jgi:hypothetical protein
MGISRRTLVGTLGAGAAALAGCSGSSPNKAADCTTEAVTQGSGGAIQEASVRAQDRTAVLDVTFLEETASASGARYLDIYDAVDQLQHTVPVDDQRTYGVTIGSIPLHGVYRISATDEVGAELDSLTVEFNCPDPG